MLEIAILYFSCYNLRSNNYLSIPQSDKDKVPEGLYD